MTVALNSLTFTFTSTANWQASKTETGFSNSLTNNNSPTKKVSLGTANANNVSGGSDEVYAAVLSVAASSSSTITITNLTDVVNQTGMSFARVKYWRFALLSTSDDSVNGTNCTSITVGAAASNPFLFNLGGTTPTVTIHNGSLWEYGDAAATGFTVTASSNDQIKIANNDGSNAAGVLVVLVGGST